MTPANCASFGSLRYETNLGGMPFSKLLHRYCMLSIIFCGRRGNISAYSANKDISQQDLSARAKHLIQGADGGSPDYAPKKGCLRIGLLAREQARGRSMSRVVWGGPQPGQLECTYTGVLSYSLSRACTTSPRMSE